MKYKTRPIPANDESRMKLCEASISLGREARLLVEPIRGKLVPISSGAVIAMNQIKR
jgi:hypothetical protein